MDYIAYYMLGIIAFAAVILRMITYNRQRKAMAKRKIKEQWGKISQRKYTFEELDAIAQYFKFHSTEGEYIDDITWNDLNMDEVFKRMNTTFSSPGQEILYNTLRCPQYEEKELKEKNKIIDFFTKNISVRENIQYIFARLGRTRRYSLSQYINNLNGLDYRSSLIDILMLIYAVISVTAIFIKPTVGILMLISALLINIFMYYKEKGEIEPYIVSFEYIIQMLKSIESLKNIDAPELKKYIDILVQDKNKLNSIKKNSSILTSGSNTAGGGIETVILDYVRMISHIDIIKFNSMLRHIKDKGDVVDEMIECLGIIESSIAIASFRESLPYYCIPKLTNNSKIKLETQQVFHPLIDNPVPNSINEDKGILLTGSNASGKSTFLKTIAINAILSQTIYTSPSKKYNSIFYKIYSSMALKDDLMGKESYYIVEIKSLKRILECGNKIPVLCFIDEVLRGTNTVERIAASAQILKNLSDKNIMCVAATHDIELTYMLENLYSNYHFQEEVEDNDIIFNYILNNGRAYSRNAIKLLGIIGYNADIIGAADNSARYFLENGEWKLF